VCCFGQKYLYIYDEFDVTELLGEEVCCFGQKYLYIYDEFDVTELLGEEVGVFAYVMYRGGAFCPGTLCVCPPPDPSVCVSPPGPLCVCPPPEPCVCPPPDPCVCVPPRNPVCVSPPGPLCVCVSAGDKHTQGSGAESRSRVCFFFFVDCSDF
jgi:hypothetical protein